MTVQSLTKRSVALLGAAILAGTGLAAIAPTANAVPLKCSRFVEGWNRIPEADGSVRFELDSRCGHDPLLPRPQTDEEKRRQEEERQRLLDELLNDPNEERLYTGGSVGGGGGFVRLIGGGGFYYGTGTVTVGDPTKVPEGGDQQMQ